MCKTPEELEFFQSNCADMCGIVLLVYNYRLLHDMVIPEKITMKDCMAMSNMACDYYGVDRVGLLSIEQVKEFETVLVSEYVYKGETKIFDNLICVDRGITNMHD
jgi:hypothetical protein